MSCEIAQNKYVPRRNEGPLGDHSICILSSALTYDINLKNYIQRQYGNFRVEFFRQHTRHHKTHIYII